MGLCTRARGKCLFTPILGSAAINASLIVILHCSIKRVVPGWAVISSGNLDLLRSAGHGAIFETPMTHSTLHFIGYAYVDDTDQVENLKITGESTSDVILRIQKAVDMWEASVKTMGGAIRPNKCYWYVVNFK